MKLRNWILASFVIAVVASDATVSPAAELKKLVGRKVVVDKDVTPNVVRHHCLTPPRSDVINLPLQREKPWSLPTTALAAEFDTTIHILVLRFNFQYETTDDPNTTGRGHINLSTDTLGFFDSTGHYIDPPPHNSVYFDAHMTALRRYYETVSEGKLSLSWDIWPPGEDSAYELPQPMSHYGRCDSVIIGLEYYFQDCIAVADSVSPEIHFANYQSIFLFHAGADRQNDIGFPVTCNDLFSGFIKFGGSVEVDSGAYEIRTALIVPETASQDNRATALNAVLAHEFGHQLGLVDFYDTRYFMTQLGDFALMDNNGFGMGIEFEGFTVGRVFGAIPLFPCAWSRAYLGFVDVYDFRQGTDIKIAAAEVESEGIKVARVPISDKEYYLIENRQVDTDGLPTVTWADRQTSVIQGPGRDGEPPLNEDYLTGEYDFLMPGSGMLIYHVDEGVMGLDYDGDGMNNFDDNDLQWDWDRRFIRIVEADGLVNLGGSYHKGFGEPEDMFRDDRQTSFTPNTNPPAVDNSGNNTRIYITNIGRDIDSSGQKPVILDTVMHFDVETDKLSAGFPKRAGYPVIGLNPVVDDIDRDGNDEIIVASDDRLSVMTTTGQSFILNSDSIDCSTCPTYEDMAVASVHTGTYHPLALYVQAEGMISAGPVTGDFGHSDVTKYIAIGWQTPNTQQGKVGLFRLRDANDDGLADRVTVPGMLPMSMPGLPIALSFGDLLWTLDDGGHVLRIDTLDAAVPPEWFTLPDDEFNGICRLDDALIVLAGSSVNTKLYYLDVDTAAIPLEIDTTAFEFGGHFTLGPILVDVNRDNIPEVAVFTEYGQGILVSIDLSLTTPENPAGIFSMLAHVQTDFEFTTNPVAGDIDADGYPDLVIGGVNHVYAFNRELTLMTDFPIEAGKRDRFVNDDVIWAPVIADIERGGRPEIVFPTDMGNLYSYGYERSYGFPLSAGEKEAGSPLVFSDTTGGKLGYLGADGWFYSWDVDLDTVTNYWPMAGYEPTGSFAFDAGKLAQPTQFAALFPTEKCYRYPYPVVDGVVTVRYFLGEDARRVDLTMYDLSGEEVDRLSGPTSGGVDNETIWNCGTVTPGVYRCMIEVNFDGRKETAFTDIAIIR